MAKNIRVSTKQLLIDRANSTIVVAVGIAAFLTAFSLVASRALLARRSYQARVIVAQEKARDQLRSNIEAVDDLKTAYQAFVSNQNNIIGGNSSGAGERDGDNAKIVLDALPSKYDFPALAASLEKILDERNYVIQAISGVDEEAAQNAATATTPSRPTNTTQKTSTANKTPTTGPKEMPFQLSAKGSYASLADLLKIFQYSIRPLNLQTVTFAASTDGSVSLTVGGKSYYQTEKELKITEKVVK